MRRLAGSAAARGCGKRGIRHHRPWPRPPRGGTHVELDRATAGAAWPARHVIAEGLRRCCWCYSGAQPSSARHTEAEIALIGADHDGGASSEKINHPKLASSNSEDKKGHAHLHLTLRRRWSLGLSDQTICHLFNSVFSHNSIFCHGLSTKQTRRSCRGPTVSARPLPRRAILSFRSALLPPFLFLFFFLFPKSPPFALSFLFRNGT